MVNSCQFPDLDKARSQKLNSCALAGPTASGSGSGTGRDRGTARSCLRAGTGNLAVGGSLLPAVCCWLEMNW